MGWCVHICSQAASQRYKIEKIILYILYFIQSPWQVFTRQIHPNRLLYLFTPTMITVHGWLGLRFSFRLNTSKSACVVNIYIKSPCNEDAVRISGPWWEKASIHRWILITKVSTVDIWTSPSCQSEQTWTKSRIVVDMRCYDTHRTSLRCTREICLSLFRHPQCTLATPVLLANHYVPYS